MLLTNIFSYTYIKALKPLLFTQDPEFVHDRFTDIGSLLGRFEGTREITSMLFDHKPDSIKQTIKGITFKSPVGLSAGFDKDANLMDILSSLGFGFTQVGTVTLHPYKGNPKPRLYRLPESKGIVVYYGLKNMGVMKIIEKVKQRKNKKFPISISIGKTNSDQTCTTDAGIADYKACLEEVIKADIGNFYTINISCPNTFGGEPFTTPAKLEALMKELKKTKYKKPLFVKMPINLAWKQFDGLLQTLVKYKVDGVIIGNLNKNYNDPLIKDSIPDTIKGGISGKPTELLSNNLIEKTYRKYKNKLVIVGVGGIFSAEDAYEKIKRGASLVQLITGMIYQGPQLIGEINKGLDELLKKDGYRNISEAVGTSVSKTK